jgi:hypothetical protein
MTQAAKINTPQGFVSADPKMPSFCIYGKREHAFKVLTSLGFRNEPTFKNDPPGPRWIRLPKAGTYEFFNSYNQSAGFVEIWYGPLRKC